MTNTNPKRQRGPHDDVLRFLQTPHRRQSSLALRVSGGCGAPPTLNENREFVIDLADEQSVLTVDFPRIRLAVERILKDAGVPRAEVSVAVVDDRAIRELNRRHLRHDYATDVLSFVLDRSDERLEGQIVVSAETARREAARYGWPPEDELLLYVVHGALHLVGYEDAAPASRAEMRRKEKDALGHFGLTPHWKARNKTS